MIGMEVLGLEQLEVLWIFLVYFVSELVGPYIKVQAERLEMFVTLYLW